MNKKRVISIAALACLSFANSAQGRDAAKLPPAEMTVVYEAAGLTERGGKVLDSCDQPVTPEVNAVDLNGDGQHEVFVQVESPCFGAAGGQLSLLVKNKQGRWHDNFGFPAGGYKILRAKTQGYPDIEIGGPGTCAPVWRWNGKAYAIHKRCDQ